MTNSSNVNRLHHELLSFFCRFSYLYDFNIIVKNFQRIMTARQVSQLVAVSQHHTTMFKAAILLLLIQPTAGFAPPSSQLPSPTTATKLHNNLRDMATYPDDMKMMQNYASFDRNGALSGRSRAGSMYGSRNYYGSDGAYYANSGMRGGVPYSSNNYRDDLNYGRGGGGGYYNGNNASRRDREISFSSSRGYNGSYSPSGRGYDGMERYGRGQRMSNAYNGYYDGSNGGGGRYDSGLRRLDSYNGSGMGYSRSQYDFRRNGDRSGYAYADSMDSRRGYRQSGMREDRSVPGFAYSSRVREGGGYGRRNSYRGDMRGMRDDYGYYDDMDGMSYGGYNMYDDYPDYGYDQRGRDGRSGYGGYGYGRSEY
jgi:hypothetical protein